jgi:IS30 family transposase
MDLVVGKAGTSPVLLTLTERVSRREMIYLLPNKKAATIRGVFDDLENTMPDFKTVFKSITTDNGSEFLQYDLLQKSIKGTGKRFEVYYCHSFSAWEKGTNENHNRMIRRFFPKGTDFSTVTIYDVQRVEDWMNHYPRKVLDWKRPCDIAA